MSDVIKIPESGEEVFYGDLLAGWAELPERERQVFELVHLQGYTRVAAAKMVPRLPGHPISEASHAALAHMVAAYDKAQGETAARVEQETQVEVTVVELHPIVAGKLAEARDELQAARADKQRQAEQALAEAEDMAREIARVEALLAGAPLTELAAS